MSWDFIGSFALIHYYIILLYEIEAERDLSIEYIYRIKEQREDLSKIEINIKNPEYINIVFQFRQRFLDLLLKILEYPKLKNIYKMNTISDEIREKSILPYLKREYKGTAWLSFGLNLALYLVISDDRDILETINNNWTNDLVSILEEISGKNASQEFFEDLFDLFDRYIESYFTQEKNEF